MTTLSKQQVSELIAQGVMRECFTSVDVPFVVDVSSIREVVLKNNVRWPTVFIPLSQELVDFLKSHREIDIERVHSLTRQQLDEPIFVAPFTDGKSGVCPIDGHHRMIGRFLLQDKFATAYVIPQNELPRATGIDIPWGNKQVDFQTKSWKQ